MSDYSTHDPKGWCGDPSRGAALGRVTIKGEAVGGLTVRRSPLDRQGYDRNGTYFGFGLPLFWVTDEGGEVDYMERAVSAEDLAKTLNAKVGEPLKLQCWGHGDDACPYESDADEDYLDLCEECAWAEQDEENNRD